MSVGERLGRLLFIVPYVAARDGVPLKELAEKLGVKPRQIEADLDLLSMVGQPPLTPDHLIDLYVEDDIVYVDLDQSLSRPLRLTHEEAGALILGAKLVGRLGGLGDELTVALDKLMAQLNPAEREMLQSVSERIALGIDETKLFEPASRLREAVDSLVEVEISYYSASSDRQKVYTLKPLAVFVHGGIEYLVALDVDADDHEKLFRLDRMGAVVCTDRSFEPPQDFDLEKFRTQKLYFGSEGFAAVVRFDKERARIVRPRFCKNDVSEAPDGAIEVRLNTSSTAWLARWVLSHGSHAEVLEPQHARAYIAQMAYDAARLYADVAGD